MNTEPVTLPVNLFEDFEILFTIPDLAEVLGICTEAAPTINNSYLWKTFLQY